MSHFLIQNHYLNFFKEFIWAKLDLNGAVPNQKCLGILAHRCQDLDLNRENAEAKKKKKRRPFGYLQLKAHLGVREWLLLASWSKLALIHVIMLLFSCSVMSDSLWPHGLQRARLPHPTPSSGACSNLCPLSRWCHPTICPPSPPTFQPLSFPSPPAFNLSQHQSLS